MTIIALTGGYGVTIILRWMNQLKTQRELDFEFSLCVYNVIILL